MTTLLPAKRIARAPRASEGNPVAALQRQDLARFRRRRDGEAESFDDLAREAHLLGVGGGEPAGAGPEAVLEPDADIAAHGRRHRRDRQLVAAGAEDGPAVLVAEQPVRRAL